MKACLHNNFSHLMILVLLLFSTSSLNANAETRLNKNLKPNNKEALDENVFEDMVVIQNKAMNKSGRFLLSTFGSFDFSDGPYTMYSLNVNPGYALSDFWEIYLSVAPFYVSQKRDIVNRLEQADYTVTSSKARYSYGAELLWSPLYGKDSLGSRKIIRSDTFIKFGAHQVKYEDDTGLAFQVALGKTYFLTKYLGLRGSLAGNYIQTVIKEEKKFRFYATVETGAVVYF